MALDVCGLVPLLQVYDMPTPVRFSRDVLRVRGRENLSDARRRSFSMGLLRLGAASFTRLEALAVRCQELLPIGTAKDYAELARLGIVTRARLTQSDELVETDSRGDLFLPEISEGCEPVSECALRRLRASGFGNCNSSFATSCGASGLLPRSNPTPHYIL